ncbi:MAG: UbiD family decarboxylase, partial [Bacteroidota bacterium]|nr:UbiD family decarboxylase [Bacteroidota bacterium]
ADFIIEGYVDPQEELIYEGPFGDHTGFYSLADYYPKFHITCITHKKNAVYPATIVGIPPQEDAWLGKATERIFLNPIKMAIAPEIIDIEMPVEGVFHNMVITKIKKTYAGQALKVMNALWGAGQMMFTKVLVVVDENVDIRNYESLAKVISENVDPMRDFHLSEGPLDVLDHSSNQFTFGGKLGIDATIKLKEEQKTIESDTKNVEDNKIDIKNIYEELPEICDINLNLLSRDISIAVITIKKKSKFHIKEINNLLFKNYFKNIKMIIYLDYKVEDNGDIFWLTLNNIDTFRDCYIVESDEYKISHIGIDATIKTKEIDGFEREWPEIIVTDNETIKLVDKKWDKYNLGKFIQSPSIKYQNYRIL